MPTPRRVVANRVVVSFVVVLELLVFVYAAYVETGELAVNWLLRPPADSPHPRPRPAAAIPILTVFWILWLLAVTSLLRTFIIAQTDPGYVSTDSQAPRRPRTTKVKRSSSRLRGSSAARRSYANGTASHLRLPSSDAPTSNAQEQGGVGGDDTGGNDNDSVPAATESVEMQTLEGSGNGDGNGSGTLVGTPYNAYDPEAQTTRMPTHRDRFLCTPTGLPYWCDRCKAFKPDRAHHSSDVDRCVVGLDHFCPWAGGIVAERNHKFFLQFVFWTLVLCVFVIATVAVSVAEQARAGLRSTHTFVTMAVMLGVAAFFALFTAALLVVHVGYALKNLTTIEDLQLLAAKSVAVKLGPPGHYPNVSVPIVQFPLPDAVMLTPSVAFAVVKTDPGTNLFDLGMWANWCNLMGGNPLSWLVPIFNSPIIGRDTKTGEPSVSGYTEHGFGPAIDSYEEKQIGHRVEAEPS